MAAREEIPLGTFEEQVLLAVIRTNDEAFGLAVRHDELWRGANLRPLLGS